LNKKKRYEILNYDKKIHLELLKDSEDLKEQRKVLRDDLRLKFLQYSVILFNSLN